jgi:hypothetical protein
MSTRHSPPAPAEATEHARVIERPDGFYWRADGGPEYGPFATLVEALRDQEAGSEDDSIEPEESLAEAEAEIGMADADPEARTLAEEDGAPIEEH